MYTGLLHLHSFLRYLILLLLVVTIVKAFLAWRQQEDYTSTDNTLSLVTTSVVHLQLLLGIGLYIMSPYTTRGLTNFGEMMGDTVLRFWTIEHTILMLAAVVLITIGRSKAKKAADALRKHKLTFWYFFISLILILAAIP